MEFGWQDIAALAIVFLAAGYLVRPAWNAVARKQTSGCGPACGGCSTQSTSNGAIPEHVVTIGPPGKISR